MSGKSGKNLSDTSQFYSRLINLFKKSPRTLIQTF